MRGRHLLTVGDLSPDELLLILDTADAFKRQPPQPMLQGRILALLFEKPSLRTRITFDAAMVRLGGHVQYLTQAEVGLGTREAVKDVARVLSRVVDIVAARTFSQSTVEELAEYSSIPVINALSDTDHPCQALADVMTIREVCGGLQGVRIAFIGDGNNVAASLAEACCMLGAHLTLASPVGFELPAEARVQAEHFAERSGGSITLIEDAAQAVRDADIIYTDVWVSMGQEREVAERREAFMPYQLNGALMGAAPSGARIMHCLPAHRGDEITDDVIDSAAFIGFDQAENRLHTEQALVALILGDGRD
jgi:ornithine carbamoyltransferase